MLALKIICLLIFGLTGVDVAAKIVGKVLINPIVAVVMVGSAIGFVFCQGWLN